MKKYPNLVDYEAKLAFKQLLRRRRRCPQRGHADRRRRGQAQRCSARSRDKQVDRGRSSGARGRCGLKRRDVRDRHPARAQPVLDGPVLPDLLRDARHPDAERRVLRRDHRGDVGRGRQVRLDRSVLPVQGRPGAHPQPAVPQHATRRSRSTTSSFPCITHVPTFDREHDGHGVAARSSPARPKVMKAAFTKEIDFFAERGIELRRPGADAHRAATCCKQQHVRRPGARASASPRTRATSRSTRRFKALRGVRATTCRAQGPRDPREVEAREPRRAPDARPPVPHRSRAEPRDPRGVPGARLPDPVDPLAPQGPGAGCEPLLRGRSPRASSRRPRHQRRVARELLGQQRAEGVGREVRRAAPERRRASTCRASSAATTRRPTASSTRSSPPAGKAVLGAARHRREQARRLDQDPRQDLRPHAEAPQGAARGPGDARRSSSTASLDREEARAAWRACSSELAATGTTPTTELDREVAALDDPESRRGARRTMSTSRRPKRAAALNVART